MLLAKEEDDDDRHSFGDSASEVDISCLLGSDEEDKNDEISVGRPWFGDSEMLYFAEEEDKNDKNVVSEDDADMLDSAEEEDRNVSGDDFSERSLSDPADIFDSAEEDDDNMSEHDVFGHEYE